MLKYVTAHCIARYDELPLNDLWGSHVDEATVAIESLMQQPSCGELAEEHM